MARLARFFRTVFSANVTIVTTAETVVCTLAGVSAQGPQCSVQLRGWAQVTLAANSTGVTLRVRRGTSVSGTLVGEANAVTSGITASTNFAGDVEVTDAPGEVAGQSYVLTVEVTGASANNTALQGSLEATVQG